MPTDEVIHLARQLRRARRTLAADSPYGPAWAATREWVDELECRARAMGIDPDHVAQLRRDAA